jgi:L-fucose mutarotase
MNDALGSPTAKLMPGYAFNGRRGPVGSDEGRAGEDIVEQRYSKALEPFRTEVRFARISREDFYGRARQAYAIVLTGETAAYGNLILRKGVTV